MTGEWLSDQDRSGRVTYVVKRGSYRLPDQTLDITGSKGEMLFSESFSEVIRVYRVYALRSSIPQLVVEYTGGGQDKFLMMLDYVDGRIVNLTKAEGLNMSFGSDVHVAPRFDASADPVKDPFQILLTNEGLASPGEKYVNVYRFRDGQYKYVGRFSRNAVDDYANKLIRR